MKINIEYLDNDEYAFRACEREHFAILRGTLKTESRNIVTNKALYNDAVILVNDYINGTLYTKQISEYELTISAYFNVKAIKYNSKYKKLEIRFNDRHVIRLDNIAGVSTRRDWI